VRTVFVPDLSEDMSGEALALRLMHKSKPKELPYVLHGKT
jgi:hypothetical protein